MNGALSYRFIFVRPRNPENIGACARAMANFGFDEMVLVDAFESDWKEAAEGWKEEASVSAIDSMDIINGARLCGSLSEASAGCDILLGTSSLHRLKPTRDVIKLAETANYCQRRGVKKAGVVFGTEKTGLTKEDLSFCNAIINIPTSDRQPSMNLGQSAAVAAYELSRRAFSGPRALRPCGCTNPAEAAKIAGALCSVIRGKYGEKWGNAPQEQAVRQALLDSRLTKEAAAAVKKLIEAAGGRPEF